MSGGVAAVVVAGGRGIRAGGDLPKQYRCVGGMAVIRRTLVAFTAHPGIAAVQPVIHPDDEERFAAAAAGLSVLPPTHGGTTRQASVHAGLEALAPHAPEIVLVHDAARPFASQGLLDRAIAAGRGGAAIPGLAVSDTVKAVDASGTVVETLDRGRLRTVQTPQAFRFDALLAAHREAAAAGRDDFTDDAALAEWAGLPVAIFEGEATNVKLTTPDDFRRAEAELMAALGDVRVGTGYDVHAFAATGDHVWLGGVKIPHDRGVEGHSDADVALHALVDAILGALADGDIGVHFPPSDPQWKGASSDRFLAFAVERVAARGGRIAHVDLTVVAEAPRLGKYRDAIRARVAEIVGLPVDRVGLKATTSEQMGFIGRREGLVAYATATVRLPWTVP
ncbi:bifunctional 2-C-methyl-D-erythritol 4-phosphate cytidylyltransferase/2-C-methyl-D-erythritol 2,4-cyclodiphosphate synthase [Rhodoplanes sp. TEM]|uniref:Bifunctional enzyme IspD/IspF n=1 Tax=Rhodoplanes tepidamans TaxID=200616 RepID=A0ABT5JJS0_RHOTP|nr:MULTISPECIES: bifunctional 2-C-methyl-D-erythritol 4-phosphate cytidylyltransferase/2-C-methyl-D-erythritol 2,4-cyclodiphosphate synthase [Rhodoplanes]MDC7789824.1 bifunctional 2-C-methyl-D-erythritol 4-phosphate cytidylyltransferase/2-C-methyl-D-erythritol 2,4-cyclodiphosphate synthase [Rhodoplanes tepidamans]MDC7987467.1 bifunctional 2-C-methyl-D-erythritol 4-phosphate cytidylyltransferase/2-C-methyl-D-erythritol 2,4-cyclodiphosphate synthase [Rhodoplanes sp. TEM]MDQ0359236.1 2-C-methyl-D-e